MIAPALSVGWYVDRLMKGPRQPGVGLGHGHIKVDSYVVAVTPPGGPRMPNGIECEMRIEPGEEVWLGDGSLAKDGYEVKPGPVWDPVPRVRTLLDVYPLPGDIQLDRLVGKGVGLTPQGDDVIVGYVAGSALFRHEWTDLKALFTENVTTSLSSTLMFHATLGELPQPAHALLEEGDPESLLAFGHSSGKGILLGLALASPERVHGTPPSRTVTLSGVMDLPDTIVRIYPSAPAKIARPLLRAG
jgi:Protein of unknown function (DUF2877)